MTRLALLLAAAVVFAAAPADAQAPALDIRVQRLERLIVAHDKDLDALYRWIDRCRFRLVRTGKMQVLTATRPCVRGHR
jgi:hypothetical protein